jgi:four helix bundle protein
VMVGAGGCAILGVMQDYRSLRVWRKAFSLALNTRRDTGSFPRSGYSSLKAQLISAAESIVFNIIEGCGAATQKEFARFLDIGIKSTMELEGQFQLARGYRILSHPEWEARSQETIELRKGLFALRKRVKERAERTREAEGAEGAVEPATKPPLT